MEQPQILMPEAVRKIVMRRPGEALEVWAVRIQRELKDDPNAMRWLKMMEES